MEPLADGINVFYKKSCPTCSLIEPVLVQLEKAGVPVYVYSQDDPDHPENISHVIDDTSLEISFHMDIETVPTLILSKNGIEEQRLVGWHRNEWESFIGVKDLGKDLPDYRPGCGSLNVEPGVAEKLAVRFGSSSIKSRRIEVASMEDDIEVCYDRGDPSTGSEAG